MDLQCGLNLQDLFVMVEWQCERLPIDMYVTARNCGKTVCCTKVSASSLGVCVGWDLWPYVAGMPFVWFVSMSWQSRRRCTVARSVGV